MLLLQFILVSLKEGDIFIYDKLFMNLKHLKEMQL